MTRERGTGGETPVDGGEGIPDTVVEKGHDGVECLSGSPVRVAVIRALRDEPLRPAELTDTVDATRTTVQRILAGFRERNWVIKREGAYHVTSTGKRVHDAYETLLSEVARADRYGEFVATMERAAPGFPTEALDDGTLTVADNRDPLAAVDRVADLLRARAGKEFRTASPIVTQRYNEAATAALEAGSRVELVVDEDVVDASVSDFAPATARAIENDRASAYVASESVEYGLFRCGEFACVIAHDERNNPRYVFESADSAVIDWVDDRYAALRADAVPLSAVIDRDA